MYIYMEGKSHYLRDKFTLELEGPLPLKSEISSRFMENAETVPLHSTLA